MPSTQWSLIVMSVTWFLFASPNPISSYASYPRPRDLTIPLNGSDETFRAVGQWDKVPLDETACIMTSFWAMRELALLDFDHQRIEKSTFAHPRFPEVGLTLIPWKDSKDLSVANALRLIAASFRNVLGNNRFKGVQFDGYQGRQAVGSLVLAPMTPSTRELNQNGSMLQQRHLSVMKDQSTISFPLSNNTPTIASLGNDKLWAYVIYLNNEIARRDLLMLMMWVLLKLGPFPIDQPIANWQISGENFDSGKTVSTWHRAVAKKASPMTNGDLVSFFAHLPEVLLKDEKWHELAIVTRHNDPKGVVLARGSIRTAQASSINVTSA
ncbi:MAG: hypothetical protein Q9191_005839 [Dirinaria sp. TL-2023a]